MSEEQGNSHIPEQPPKKTTVSFAPADPTDGRPAGSWRTRYEDAAQPFIRKEAIYVGFLLFIIPTLIICIHQNLFGLLNIPSSVKKYSYAWIGGSLGGTLFTTKWLYHSVARDLWNQDRFLWRIFTPHISGALAFSFILLISSGIINLFSPTAMDKNNAVFGVSFLIGYFSDSAIAKLTEIANTIFGATQKEQHRRSDNAANSKP
jgi:hypothetical protein